MAYTEQQWQDDTITAPFGPINGTRLSHIETGINAAAATADTATTAAAAAQTRADFAAEAVFNVKDPAYGALGDGSNNDTTAIQAAITAAQSAGGGIIYFPIGVYKCTTGLTVTNVGISFQGAGWNQTTTTVGSILKAGGTYTDLVNANSTAERFSMTDMSLDGNGTATNLVTVDALNCQFTRCYGRRPATNGTGWNVTSGGTSVWLTDCRFNGANQAGCFGFAINGTDSTMTGCKAVNCLDSVTYGSTASGAIQQGCHHTPGSTIGRCCINIAGNAANVQIIGNRIDNHALGSGIQVTPSSNIQGLQIVGNLFYQNVITDATFAAIGLDPSNAHIYQAVINGNIIRSASSHNYTALLTAQTLAGAGATNPTRVSSDGTTVSGNSVYAAAMYGTSSSPLVARGNVLSTNGTTYALSADI